MRALRHIPLAAQHKGLCMAITLTTNPPFRG
jgi:hypothetical protein